MPAIIRHNPENQEPDTEDVGDALIEGLKELIEAKEQGRELPSARDLLNSL